MKVYIGPYTKRWVSNIFEKWLTLRYANKYYDGELTRFDGYIEYLDSRLQDLYNATINKYLDNKERNVKVHVDYYDVWDLDHTLSIIILPCLKKLREVKHGSPKVDPEDVPEHFRPTKSDDPYDDDTIHDRWDYVLNEMIWTFEQKNLEDWTDQFYHEMGEYDFVDVEGTSMSKIVCTKEPVIDQEGMQANKERMDNGMRLFGKYFSSLWD